MNIDSPCECVIKNRATDESQREWLKRVMCMQHWMQTDYYAAKTAAVNPPVQGWMCPDCDGEMVARKSQYGNFWGCKKYPKCKGTRDTMGRSKEEARAERDAEEQIKNSNDGSGTYTHDNVKYRFGKE